MKAQVTTQVTIAASSEEVFRYLENSKYHFLWSPSLQSLHPQKKLSLGDTYEATNIVLGIKVAAHNEVTDFVRNKEFELQNSTGMLHYCTHFKLLPVEKGTKVKLSVEVSSESKAFAFSAPVLRRLVQRELQTDLQALKIAVEQQLS